MKDVIFSSLSFDRNILFCYMITNVRKIRAIFTFHHETANWHWYY